MKHHDNLIRMANRIGQFFEAYPDEPEALEGIANHIQQFWEPRMRNQLRDFMERYPDGQNPDSVSLLPIVAKAVSINLKRLTPA